MTSSLNLVVIIQARMGSSRLPGKVLKPLYESRSVLELMLNRIKQSRYLTDENIIIATSTLAQDEPIVSVCNKIGIKCYRGSERNVLERYYFALESLAGNAQHIMRLTADCPLHDSNVINACIEYFQSEKKDYISNTFKRMFPKGLDIEIMKSTALKMAYQKAKLDDEIEHVTPYIRKHPEQFSIENFDNNIDLSHHRWTLDYQEDYDMICHIYKELYPKNPNFGMNDILELLEKRPDIYKINAHLERD